MKKQQFILLVFFAFFAISVKSQNEKTPSKEELQQMMKEMQEGMEDMDPESKEMMKKMGIAMPDMKTLEYAVSGDYTDAGPIPKRDEARIQKAKQTKLNSGNVADYIQRVHQAVSTKVGPGAVQSGKEIYQSAKSSGGGAQAANGLWAFGANLPAVVVLGNTLTEDPKNTDNLNNYAAFLVMTGAEEGAIPILEYLNKIYPKNSTILNNLGQAWFGLGELEVATNYFDSIIAQYAGHSQANLTKSLIQESKGDKAGAIQSMKRSIKTAYSPAKEERLRTLGYKPKGGDIGWAGPIPQDPLGFGQMNWPRYPKTVSESEKLEPEWEAFREELKLKSSVVEEKYEKASDEFEENLEEDPIKKYKELMKSNLKLPPYIMPFSLKARAKMEYYNENDEALELAKYQELLQNDDSLQTIIHKIELKFGKELEELEKQDNGIGEGGTEAQREAYCAARDKINDKYLETVNALLENENQKWISYWQKSMSRRLNYIQYAMPEDAFEMEKLRAQLMWLGFIGGQKVEFENKCTFGSRPPKQKLATKKLADFYDMTCKQKSVMNLGIGSVTIECNKMTTEFEAWFVKYSSKENMDNGTIIRGTVEIGKDFNIGDEITRGPVKAELKAGVGAFIEFDSEGVTDCGVKGGISADVGTNLVPKETAEETGMGDPSTTAFGAEARWGWNSGGSVAGKGLLNGLNIKLQ